MKALLLAAGLGTRLKPFTDRHPKALATVHGMTLLEWNIRNLQRFGIFEVVVNVHHFADQIETLIKENEGFGSRVALSDEREAVLETGGGLLRAAPLLQGSDPLLVMNVDILSDIDLSKMRAYHQQQQPLATLAVQQRASSRYLVFQPGTGQEKPATALQLCGWKNAGTGEERFPGGAAPTESLQQLAFSGIQLLHPDIFHKIKREGKFSLIDLYLDLCSREKVFAWDHTGDLLLDVGKPESLEKAAVLFPGAPGGPNKQH